jgi:hypothetical protein
MEFCPGGTLSRRLASGPLEARAAAELVRALALAIQTAHKAKVIHRDLKPANVLFTADGTPKVADFGLARKLDEADRTRSGVVLGTPSYMAPEQARGRRREVGPGADIYALGAILYECLTGKAPFKGESDVETVLQVVSQPPVPVRSLRPSVPRELEAICLRCLRKEPGSRYGSARALADDLGRFLEGTGKGWPVLGGLRQGLRLSLAALVVLLAGLLAGLAAVPAPVPPPPALERGNLYGVIVGISAETHPSAENAVAMYRALLRQKGALYKEVELQLLVTEEDTTRGAILGALWALRRVGPEDRVIVYLSGRAGSLDEPGKGFIFSTSDADLEDRPESGLTGRDLLRVLAALPGRSCVVIDANHAGALIDDLSAVRFPAGREPVILAACARGQEAIATVVAEGKPGPGPRKQRGVFTAGLLRAIAGRDRAADRNREGVLLAREAFAAASARVAAEVRELRKGGEVVVQLPRLHLPHGVVWPLARPRAQTTEEPNEVESAGPPAAGRPRE